MLRRKFLQNLAWITGGLFLSRCTPAKALGLDGKSLTGRVMSKGRAIKGAVVSDGYSVVETDRKGRYTLLPHAESTAVFVSVPAGYAFTNERGVVRHYHLMQTVKAGEDVNFELIPLDRNDLEHEFIVWADPQVRNAKDVQKMMEESVPDVQRYVAAAGTNTLLHGITVGDIVWDELKLFDDYNKAVSQMNIPFFQCLGNHDMDYRKGGDETSDDTFQQTYGPTYYSFNRGEVHYVVMDNVRYLGTERNYDGWIQQHQLDWLKNDLSFVPKDKLIVLCVHIPIHSGTKNKADLYALLDGRQAHIMSGHTHYNVNAINGSIFEHNHGTVCGAWWTGPICEDGTPCGYGIYKVNGKKLTWHYQCTGKPAEYQMRTFANDYSATEKQVVANIWNFDPAWRTEYWVDGINKGPLEQFEGFDPDAYKAMLGPDLPKPRGFAEPKKTKHLFKALVPVGSKEVKIIATDRFDRTYTAIQTLLA